MVGTINIFIRSDGCLSVGEFTPNSLYSMFFRVLGFTDRSQAQLLHDKPHPKPYAIAYSYSQNKDLAGFRISTFSSGVFEYVLSSFTEFMRGQQEYKIGKHSLYVEKIEESHFQWEDFYANAPLQNVPFRFLTPTCFRKGNYCLQLPLPSHVFNQPYVIWQTYAPNNISVPNDFLDWVGETVFVSSQKIQTLAVPLSVKTKFIGFVGYVLFHAQKGPAEYLRAFQTLGNISVYTGIGYKTTIGMGVVERIE